MINQDLLEEYHIKEAFPILDMLSVYSANTLFSQESPMGGNYTKTRNETIKELEKLIHPFSVDNKSINIILETLHQKFLTASKAHLVILNKDNNYGVSKPPRKSKCKNRPRKLRRK